MVEKWKGTIHVQRGRLHGMIGSQRDSEPRVAVLYNNLLSWN
jgi:hypothetical protein